jgi:hypothetical protein
MATTLPENADVVFFPWVRQGAAAAIGVVDTLKQSQRGVVDLTANLSINISPIAPVTVRLRGPADVVGIDPSEIVRMDPRPGTADFEPNYFVAIEFDRPDFPWLFTPAKADPSNPNSRLRPWLCLVVVRDQSGVTLRSTSDAPLPALEIAAPARPIDELPDLNESWWWAHAQVASPGSASADDLRNRLGGKPELSLSRLLSPRLLQPSTDYIACVVPTFDVGRKAGLGMDVTEAELTSPTTGLKPAWSFTPVPTLVTLPVYHSWRFRTGEGGDFESLVRLLQPRGVPALLGKRTIDISQPGFKLSSSDTTLALEGALQPMNAPPSTPGPSLTFQTELAKIVNLPGIVQAIDSKADPLLAPPLYGRWHAARATVTPGATPWLDELNLDPRHRSVAAFGTRVIQEHQEALMAAAWEQAADLQRANQRVRQLQLTLAAASRLHTKHFKTLSPEALMRIGAPAFARLRAAATGNSPSFQTLVAGVNLTVLPIRATSPAMRRIGRERGPISRRVAAQGGTARTATWMTKLVTIGTSFVGQPWMDLVTVSIIRQRIALPSTIRPFEFVTALAVTSEGTGNPSFQIVPEGQRVPVNIIRGMPLFFDNAAARNFRPIAAAHLTRINPARAAAPPDAPKPLVMTDVSGAVLSQIEPLRTVTALARAVVTTRANATPPASTTAPATRPIDTIMAAPKFRQPMYEPLRDLSPQLMLPGLESVLPNTVLGLQTNRRFVEVYMAGLNFEMGRELLWRGYPTDQRGTCFDQFWDTRGSASPKPDVRPLVEWGLGRLGDFNLPPVKSQFVMLMRSDLLRRYPTAVIYAVRALLPNPPDGTRFPSPDPKDEVHPSFRGSLPPDVSFFGFDLPVEAVIGASATSSSRVSSAGYYIVIQEQPSEPRFGLDVGTAPANATHLQLSAGPPSGVSGNGLVWGRNAAHMAGITRQQPVRILIHASQLVSPPGTGESA